MTTSPRGAWARSDSDQPARAQTSRTLGGGVHNTYGALLLIDVTFTSNDADSVGGGWSNHNTAGTVTAGAVTYANNSAGSGDYEDCYDVNGGCAQ